MKTFLLGTALSLAGSFGLQSCDEPATIGGHEVPAGLACEEDEAIWFDQSADKVLGEDGRMGYPLGCVHIDSIRYPARTSPDVGD
jgi:hypothetical protein